ncbi:hypothetical protein [Nonomuraea sp. NPDC049480]
MPSAKSSPESGEKPQEDIEELIDELEIHSAEFQPGTGETDTCNVCSTLP